MSTANGREVQKGVWTPWSPATAESRCWPNRVHALNVPAHLTAGLMKAYAIVRRRLPSPPVQATGADGRLVLSPTMPLIGQRYQFLYTISESDLSQVVVCMDTFRRCKPAIDGRQHPTVAVKVVNAKHWTLGAQEFERMRLLWQALEHKGTTGARIIKPLHHFEEQAHFCIVFGLLRPLDAITQSTGQRPQAPESRYRIVHADRFEGDDRVVYDFLHSCSTDVSVDNGAALRPCLSLSALRHFTASMLGSLAVLHEHEILHADLKPENILCETSTAVALDEKSFVGGGRNSLHWLNGWLAGRVVLIDFSNAIRLSECEAYYDTFEVQTLPYRAPEVLYGLPFDTKIDMWSLGMTLCELVSPALRAVAIFSLALFPR